MQWGNNAKSLVSPIVRGDPFVTVFYTGSTPKIVTEQHGVCV